MGKWKLKRAGGWDSQPHKGDWMPLPALGATVTGFLIAFVVAEAALAGYQHPLHWIAAAMGGTAGYVGGLLFHLWHSAA